MKLFLNTLLAIFFTHTANSQNPILDINGSVIYTEATPGTYLKDINHSFDNFLGTWKYQNGNKILIIKLEKVEMYYNSDYSIYEDYIKGNYSYTIDGGTNYIVNTIQQNLGNLDPNDNVIYSCGPETPLKDKMTFYDVLYNKNAWVHFTFQNTSFNQLYLKLENSGRGYFPHETIPNPAFCIPNNVILIKQ